MSVTILPKTPGMLILSVTVELSELVKSIDVIRHSPDTGDLYEPLSGQFVDLVSRISIEPLTFTFNPPLSNEPGDPDIAIVPGVVKSIRYVPAHLSAQAQ